jgi:DNA-binding GntR family transcriptional regulator
VALQRPGPPAAWGARHSLVERAYRTIRQRVIDNTWPAGYRALEHDLADELGMSRTPLREALVRLENEGLIRLIPRHGMTVLPVSHDDMRDIYEMLAALEAMAAELAVRRRPSEAALKPLADAASAMERALLADDLDAWAAAEEDFHRHLVALSGNRLIIDTVQNCSDRTHRARMVTLRLRARPVESTREHRDLVEKMRAGNACGAFQSHRAHRERGAREMLAILDRHQLKVL